MTLLDVRPATVTIDGKDYIMELGTVSRTMLGYEDHGIFSFTVTFDFSSGTQGLGHWSLLWSKHGPPETDPLLRLKRVMDVVGADEWEAMKNRKAYILHRVGNAYGPIMGLVSIDQQKYIILREE